MFNSMKSLVSFHLLFLNDVILIHLLIDWLKMIDSFCNELSSVSIVGIWLDFWTGVFLECSDFTAMDERFKQGVFLCLWNYLLTSYFLLAMDFWCPKNLCLILCCPKICVSFWSMEQDCVIGCRMFVGRMTSLGIYTTKSRMSRIKCVCLRELEFVWFCSFLCICNWMEVMKY